MELFIKMPFAKRERDGYIIATIANDMKEGFMAIIIAVAQCAALLGQVIYGIIFESFSDMLYFPILAVSLLMFVIAFVARRMFASEPVSQ